MDAKLLRLSRRNWIPQRCLHQSHQFNFNLIFNLQMNVFFCMPHATDCASQQSVVGWAFQYCFSFSRWFVEFDWEEAWNNFTGFFSAFQTVFGMFEMFGMFRKCKVLGIFQQYHLLSFAVCSQLGMDFNDGATANKTQISGLSFDFRCLYE